MHCTCRCPSRLASHQGLLTGADLFASEPAPAVACQVYPTAAGIAGQPALEDLRRTIRAARRTPARSDGEHQEATVDRERAGIVAGDARTEKLLFHGVFAYWGGARPSSRLTDRRRGCRPR